MEGQYPSLPDMVATAQPRRMGVGLSLGFLFRVTDIEIPPVVRILNEEPLHDVVEPVAMYSTLVYKHVMTGEWGIMMQTLHLQKDALDQGPGAMITKL